jgi:23S rRNA (adenine-N6)-dimethyltransferase
METGRHKRRSLGQNFLTSPHLVRELVRHSSIGTNDIVVEIGPGRGIITAELARRAKAVVAIEKDAALVTRLRERFRNSGNVTIVQGDILQVWDENKCPYAPGSLHIGSTTYKIFASIPYNITAPIVRKILYDRCRPAEAYLILQKEPARKFAGIPRETLASILAKPFCEIDIIRHLKRTDFEPVPEVDSVLLRIFRRRLPLVQKEEVDAYRNFVEFGFKSWKKNLRLAYKNAFGYKRWKRVSRQIHLPLNATPTELTFEQWLALFREWRSVN